MIKLKQVKAIENGKGLQYLLDAAKRIFRNPISITDMNYGLIAFTDDNTEDPIWNGMTSTWAFSEKSRNFFAKKFFAEYIANADKYTIFKSEEIKCSRIVGYIHNRENVKVGLVSMYEFFTPFDEEIHAAFELFTAKISSELRNGKHRIKLGSTFQEDMINRLRYAERLKRYC